MPLADMAKQPPPQAPSNNSGFLAEDLLYTELWRACACAGPLVTVRPSVGDLVFYFPQGHIEQVEASTNQVAGELPLHSEMPSNLLCRVLNVELKVTDADEVYAWIILLPEPDPKQKDLAAEKPSSGSSAAMPRPAVRSFCKTLTVSDTSTNGGFSVLRHHAEECLPPLDMTQSPPTQDLVAKDLRGKEWRFRHIFREQRKRHFFTNGWSVFVSSKRLVPGDAFIFLRSESGELRVGVRRPLTRWPPKVPSLVIPSHSMVLGILAAASQAVQMQKMFTVLYYPRTSPSEFIIPYDQYMESGKTDWSVGMRFRMKFEGERGTEETFAGTIVGCGNLSPRWPDSSWRCLKVRWDEPASIPRPDRVSPWDIEPASSPPVEPLPLPPRVKKPRLAPLPSPESYVLTKEGTSNKETDVYCSAANWSPARPRLVAYATSSSSSSSDSLSSTYTSGSSHLQSSSDQGCSVTLSMHLVEEIANKLEHVQFPWLELEEEKEKLHGHIKDLVQEFCTTRNSALVLERWFSDLGVSWVLSIVTVNESASAFVFPQQLGHLARSWIAALNVIQVCVFTYLDRSCNKVEATFSPFASEFARFLQSTVSKMLLFVDAVAAPNVGPPRIQDTLSNSSSGDATTEPTTEEKLQALIGLRDALAAASEQIQLWPHSPPFLGSSRDILDEMSKLLSAKLDKLDEAILDTVDEIRKSITPLLLDSHEAASMDSEAVQRSPDIHKVTRFIVNCIKVLSANYTLVHQIVSKAASLGKYVPEYGKSSPLTMNIDAPFAALITEMISCLQEKLLRVSQPFPDQSLRFLFLLNNTYFMWQQLHPSSALEPHMSALTCKVNDHILSYLQVSWAPVLSCLHDPTPLCLGRYSPLAKFQLEFQKTSTAQKLWKVPDPELRRRLRKAIIDKVSSGFTKYLEDHNIISPRVTSQELEETLQELFEG